MRDLTSLQRIPLLAHLPPATLSRIARKLLARGYAPGEVIVLEGESSPFAYFLAEGRVRLVRTSQDGREQEFERLGPGGSFNTTPPFGTQATTYATAQAIDQVLVYVLPKDELRWLAEEHSTFALALLRDFADRLCHLSDLVEDLSLRSVRGRLARLLLQEAEADRITRRWTQAEIAARLGTVREMISRTLGAFADAGLIRIDRQRIVLLDKEGLESEIHR